ncbi:hypothetical protein KEM56_000027 [Ascosphaera pollenicola]|nr:hypothetical protein KEM56_000027 [Ascosphaera pollenicola]
MDTAMSDQSPSPQATAPNPSLLHSNLENLLSDNPTTETPPAPSRSSSPAKSVLGSLWRKRKRGFSQGDQQRTKRPLSAFVTDAFVAGNDHVEPVNGIPIPRPPSPPDMPNHDNAHHETMVKLLRRKMRRLIAWCSRAAWTSGASRAR